MTDDKDTFDDLESVLDSHDTAEKSMAEKGLEMRPGFAFAYPEKDAEGNPRAVRLLQALPRRDAAGVAAWEAMAKASHANVMKLTAEAVAEQERAEGRKKTAEQNRIPESKNAKRQKGSTWLEKPSKGEIESFLASDIDIF